MDDDMKTNEREYALASGYHGVGGISEAGTAGLLASYRRELQKAWNEQLSAILAELNKHVTPSTAHLAPVGEPLGEPAYLLGAEISEGIVPSARKVVFEDVDGNKHIYFVPTQMLFGFEAASYTHVRVRIIGSDGGEHCLIRLTTAYGFETVVVPERCVRPTVGT